MRIALPARPIRMLPSRGSAPSILFGASTPLLALLLLPILAIVLKSPPVVLLNHFTDPSTQQAIRLSLITSTLTALSVGALGTPISYLLARRRFRGRGLLEVLIDLPTVLPPAAAGLGLLMAFGRRGLLGGGLQAIGLEIPFTPLAVVLAQTFVAAPYFLKTAAVALAAVSTELEQAASLDGASSLYVFRFVTLPIAWRGMAAASALCWARALGEFGATIIFAGNFPGRTQTMPLALYLGFEMDLNRALTLAAVLLTLSFAILITVRAVLRDPGEAS